MKVVISTPKKVILEKDADRVFLPLKGGDVTVLDGYAPMVGVLKEGDIRCQSQGKEESVHIKRGVVMARNNRLEVLSR